MRDFCCQKKKKEKKTPEWMMMEAQHNRINPSINAPQVVRDYTYMTLLPGIWIECHTFKENSYF